MSRDEAYLLILANFAYIDGEISKEEADKIKSIQKKLGLIGDVDKIIKGVVENPANDEIERYAGAIAYLSQNLTKSEKMDFLKYCSEIITADGKVLANEIVKLELLARNWELELSKIL
ncbi:MAG TPA: TerB family tellurite resistance protein [Spirochaetota bacterium]|nr:TerB family tellurite resistance protein [Spirochaetota bacterium]HOS32759.1 TerB family tellurite resistance protein [Spirochaetota bacterium]HOS55274.1 TerB family tellurite resistance protein [Spirochaetota bacterium]HQF77851.1 TerB family tellurite resistance protein [Spirochaetota bacterium]HQH31018.1 TerB family tellurite resistance protein [Spirochaetota bacterium]